MATTLDLIKECKPAGSKKLSYKRAYDLMYALFANRCIALFDWQGLPFPQHELELRTQFLPQGYTGVVYSPKLDRWIVALGAGVGVTEYPDIWIDYVWACPLDSGKSKIGTQAALIRNNSMLISSRMLVDYYATIAAHAIISMQALLINSRATGYSVAQDDATKKQILNFYKSLEEGRIDVVLTQDPLMSAPGTKPAEFISDQITGRGDRVLDYWQLIQNIYKDFLAMIGISKAGDKRERLITSEVEQDLPLYRFNIEDMLDQRRIAAEDLSRIMGADITVDLAESVKQSQEGGGVDETSTAGAGTQLQADN